MLRGFVDSDVKRAIHRLDPKLLALDFHRREHRIDVVDLVPAREPQVALGDVRREDESITAKQKLLAQVIFHLLADRAAFRVPEDQALSVVFLNRKQVELTTKTTMISLLRFFTLL